MDLLEKERQSFAAAFEELSE
jgi:hypothetical protein